MRDHNIFFLQAEDGIRDRNVTGVQTCALRSRVPDADLPEPAGADRRVGVQPAAAAGTDPGEADPGGQVARRRLHHRDGAPPAADGAAGGPGLRHHRSAGGRPEPGRGSQRGQGEEHRTVVREAVVERTGGGQARDRSVIDPADLSTVEVQIGRPPRGTRAVAHRCPCGLPDVVQTSPRLADGTPFPTLFYLTCPRATSACSRLESAGVMKEMMARLQVDRELAAAYLGAHEDYLARRTAIADVPEIDGTSAGGMP